MFNLVDPNLINKDEEVTIQDDAKNVVRGAADFNEKGHMVVRAFRLEIPFAKWSQRARGGLGGYAPVKGIKIVGHQPPIEAFSFDVVPKQQFRSNPT